MQLMWVSHPTARVRVLSISARKVAWTLGLSTFVLIGLGVLLYFVGFRLAVEASPELARQMGGVTTKAAQEKAESVYRDQLEQLRQAYAATLKEVRQIELLKNQFMEVATPANLREPKNSKDKAKGGPWVAPYVGAPVQSGQLAPSLAATLEQLGQTQAALESLAQDWSSQLKWLKALPTASPLEKDHQVTSGFGIRNDPFTRQLAMHEGLDFVAEVGTPIVATANGRVVRSERDEAYGHVVEVRHIEGFVSRYAHLSKRLVAVGDEVQRGQTIAQLGNTGRSTGPHLHYEILQHDRALNPAKFLVQASGLAR